MKAVIMAGGQGTRLRPLTSDQPKPMIPIANLPCMEHIVGLLKRHGFDDISVTLQFMPEEIREYFGDGSDWGVKIRYATQTGTTPPRFTVFANRPDDLPDNYLRYVENALRKRYDLWGVAVGVRTRSSR